MRSGWTTTHDLFGAGFGLGGETWPDFVCIVLEHSLDGWVRDLGFDIGSATRIRRAFDDGLPLLDAAPIAGSYGDLRPEHVLLDPGNESVVAVIDWVDHGWADAAWDLAVLTLEDTRHLDALLDGYGPRAAGEHAQTRRSLYRVLRWLTEAIWFAERSHQATQTSLARATTWRAGDQ